MDEVAAGKSHLNASELAVIAGQFPCLTAFQN
jgi:hypothetical protein